MAETQHASFALDYPEVKLLQVRESLAKPYPVWLLTAQGLVVKANLLAFWLWEAAYPHNLLSVNAYDIYSRNLKRMPKEKNREFFAKKSAVVKRFSVTFGEEPFASFITAMKGDPDLRKIYEHAVANPVREWEYPIRIIPHEKMNSNKLMEFHVTVSRLEGDRGLFLATYHPTLSTIPIIKRQFGRLIDQYSDDAYVLSGNREMETTKLSIELPTVDERGPNPVITLDRLMSHYPTYYPAITHDRLWNITGENEAHRWLWNTPVVGRHLLELFFSPPFRPSICNWDISAPRAMKYFDIVVAIPVLESKYENHSEYDQIIECLSKLDGFLGMYIQRKSIELTITLPENPKNAFLACTLSLRCPFSDVMKLHVNTMVQLVQEDGKDYYLETFVPENYETKVALILMHLAHSPSAQEEMSKTPFEQYLWGLAVLKTVEEGITKRDTDARWEPPLAFRRIHNELKVEFNKGVENMTDPIIARIRTVIEKLNRKKLFRKGVILDMLIDFTENKIHLMKLLTLEREIHRAVKGTEAPLAFDQKFQNKVRDALLEMINSPKNGDVLGGFISAYQYRKQFPWLGESGNFPDKVNKDGLAYAIRYALSTYIVPEVSDLETPVASAILRDARGRNEKRIDAEWVSKLTIAITAAIDEGFSLEQFANRLSRAGMNVETIASDALQEHIAGAIIEYYNRRMIGTSFDPF